ncbi:MAG: prepilin-type N-terminal cleavage/methylation domain-containing protein [Phycisphaerales bacterium]|nr:prepilin-type N-terminal cleavage/methylation domain-containing protein [Phycisphaerales bacterium]
MMRSGFTLVEVMVSVVILVIAGAILILTAGPGDAGRASTTARLLASDLEHAQVLALARPDHRIALSIDADGGGWRIVDASQPDRPLLDALDESHRGRVLETRLGEGRASMLDSAQVTPGGLLMVFTPLGGLEAHVPTMRASVGAATASISVSADTGFATILD